MSILTKLRKLSPALTPPDVKADARVAIAQDVLDTLKVGRMVPVKGEYFHLDAWSQEVGNESFERVALAVRRKGKTTCEVCAIGAAALCAVGLYDAPGVLEETHDADDMRDVLSRWFTRKQLDLIECAFEMSDSFYEGEASEEAREKAKDFGVRFPNAWEGDKWVNQNRERLEAIMQNIVDNKGTFRT